MESQIAQEKAALDKATTQLRNEANAGKVSPQTAQNYANAVKNYNQAVSNLNSSPMGQAYNNAFGQFNPQSSLGTSSFGDPLGVNGQSIRYNGQTVHVNGFQANPRVRGGGTYNFTCLT